MSTRTETRTRNGAAILDAVHLVLERGEALSMSAVAAEAGVSRPTLYAHHPTLADVLEAALTRSAEASARLVGTADLREAAPLDALDELLGITWTELARHRALAAAAAEHLSPVAITRAHAALTAPLEDLVRRGQAGGTFRDDVPADWLLQLYFTLAHGADEFARSADHSRADVLAWLRSTARAAFSRAGGSGTARPS